MQPKFMPGQPQPGQPQTVQGQPVPAQASQAPSGQPQPGQAQIFGIVNVTRDSFSDGDQFLTPQAAIEHARQLLADGADVIDLGAESTHPDAEDVSVDEEIKRLTPVVASLKRQGASLSIDTHKPEVMRAMLGLGVDVINDISGMCDQESVAAVAASCCKVVVMHSRSAGPRAERAEVDAQSIVDEIIEFFRGRIDALQQAGVSKDRIIIDPGMGFFLGTNAEASYTVLRELDQLCALGLPVMISTSRKSFIGAALGEQGVERSVHERSAGTLATEIWASLHGAAWIRTHAVKPLRDALRILQAIAASDQA